MSESESLRIVAGTGKNFCSRSFDEVVASGDELFTLEEFIRECNDNGFTTELNLLGLLDATDKSVYYGARTDQLTRRKNGSS